MSFTEPLSKIFEVENLSIVSDDWTVPCLPGFAITTFYKPENIQQTEKQVFLFRVKTKDTIENDFSVGKEFSYSTDCHEYIFRIAAPLVDDMFSTGTSKFRADFISREVL
jgi:hypothetical protein